jgi:hypothetical protein
MRKHRSPLTDVMEYYEDDVTRENYVATNYFGSVGPHDTIPAAVESTFPAQFRRSTLLETKPASDRIQ